MKYKLISWPELKKKHKKGKPYLVSKVRDSELIIHINNENKEEAEFCQTLINSLNRFIAKQNKI